MTNPAAPSSGNPAPLPDGSDRADRRGRGGSMDRPAPGAAGLAGGGHGLGRDLRLPRTLVVRDHGRSGRANHLAVEGALQPGRNLRELSQPVVRPGLDAQPPDHAAAPGAGVWAGRAGRRASGCALRLFSQGASLLPADDSVRPQHPRGRAHSLDLFALRHRRAAESHVHLHCLRGLRRLGHDAGRAGGRQPVHRHGVHAGRGHLADDRQGAAAARAAQRVQLVALDLRPGLRLHHAGRGGEVRRRDRRPGRPDQYLATARAARACAPDLADHPGRRPVHRPALFLCSGRVVSLPLRRHAGS